jgi:N-acetylmuramoyl-L-alanine amidase
MTRIALICTLLLFAIQTSEAKIVLVYPRTTDNGAVFRYSPDIDSTFLVGRIEPACGRLLINGMATPVWPSGAFLSWMPLRKIRGQRHWDLERRANDRVEDSLTFDYEIADENALDKPDTLSHLTFPRVIQVDTPHAHTLTTAGGSYHLFPDVGCRLLARSYANHAFRIDFGGGFAGTIPAEYVHIETDSLLPDAMLRNGSCTRVGSDSRIALAITRSVPWAMRPARDQRSVTVTLFGTRLDIDRLRYTVSDPLLEQIVWTQLPYGLDVEFRCRAEVDNGCDISFADDSLVVFLRADSAPRKELKGRTIVVDAGHGGASDGTIGPLGTREKDITLKWAGLLKEELMKQGATVALTRDSDRTVDLYERIEFARARRADFLISLHANALPDGENPFERHGTGTYYYQSAARTAAEILHRHLLAAGGLRDDGLYFANLAVTRPTLFPAVLIEGAFLIWPPEETLLKSEPFLRKMSRAIVDGLREYYRTRR